MSWWTRLEYLLPWRRRQEDRELDAELLSITELAAEDLGTRQAARKALGNLTLAKEDARAVSRWAWLESVAADVAYGLRVLRREKVFAAATVISLALCIGANAAIFSLVDAVLVRMLPVREPERLVAFGRGSLSYSAWEQYQERSARWMSGVLATYGAEPRELDAGGGPFRGSVDLVSGNYFGVLGVSAVHGRTITPDDDRRQNPAPVTVVSYGFWKRQLGGGPVLGRTVRVQGVPLSIVGVAPPGFFGISVGEAPDVWVPLALQPAIFPSGNWLDKRNVNFLDVVGRLRPGVGARAVELNLDQEVRLFPAAHGTSALRRRFSKPLHIVFAMVAASLVLGCVNVMGLQLARASERRREIGVRLAMGAGRGRIVRQLLTESSLVAIAAAALGLLICRPIAAALLSLITQSGEPVRVDAGVNGAVLGFVCALAFAVVLISGVLPALRATRVELLAVLQSDVRSATAGRKRRWLGRSLMCAQMALSLFLVAAGCLFAASLGNLRRFDVGLDRTNLTMLEVDAKNAGYDAPRAAIMIAEVLRRLRSLPGVRVATFAEIGAFTGSSSTNLVHVDGYTPQPSREPVAFFDRVGPRFFATLGAKLLAGRDFDERDDASAPRVAVVNESFARHFFPDRNPLGCTVYVGEKKTAWEVVGVVRDIRVGGPRSLPDGTVYLPVSQSEGGVWSSRFVVRTDGASKVLPQLLRQVVRQQDSRLPVVRIATGGDLLNRILDKDRLMAFLAQALAVLALAIAALGIYGSLSYYVARRTNEVGVRMALGANRSGILLMVLREVALWCLAGVALGTAAALACGRIVANLLFGLETGDPLVLSAAAGILVTVALAAAWGPAHRAASVEPMTALRHE